MDFDELEGLIIAAGGAASVAELHGTLCGCISGGRALDAAAVGDIAAETLAMDADAIAEVMARLQQLYREADAGLRDEDYSFTPLLPGDDEPMAERIQALAGWCQGYLSGLGRSGLAGDARLSADVTAAIRDLAAIALADPEVEDEPQSEADLVQLIEYVRVAAMLVFAEVADPPNPPPVLH